MSEQRQFLAVSEPKGFDLFIHNLRLEILRELRSRKLQASSINHDHSDNPDYWSMLIRATEVAAELRDLFPVIENEQVWNGRGLVLILLKRAGIEVPEHIRRDFTRSR